MRHFVFVFSAIFLYSCIKKSQASRITVIGISFNRGICRRLFFFFPAPRIVNQDPHSSKYLSSLKLSSLVDCSDQ